MLTQFVDFALCDDDGIIILLTVGSCDEILLCVVIDALLVVLEAFCILNSFVVKDMCLCAVCVAAMSNVPSSSTFLLW